MEIERGQTLKQRNRYRNNVLKTLTMTARTVTIVSVQWFKGQQSRGKIQKWNKAETEVFVPAQLTLWAIIFKSEHAQVSEDIHILW